MTNKITFIIKISDAYKLQCYYIDSNKKETIIQLLNKKRSRIYTLWFINRREKYNSICR